MATIGEWIYTTKYFFFVFCLFNLTVFFVISMPVFLSFVLSVYLNIFFVKSFFVLLTDKYRQSINLCNRYNINSGVLARLYQCLCSPDIVSQLLQKQAKTNQNKKREGKNVAIHQRIGNLKNTHVGNHLRVHTSEGPYIETLAIHTSERYPYIGTLSIHRNARYPYIGMLSIHRRSIHQSFDVWMVHTSESYPYIGGTYIGTLSIHWRMVYTLEPYPLIGGWFIHQSFNVWTHSSDVWTCFHQKGTTLSPSKTQPKLAFTCKEGTFHLRLTWKASHCEGPTSPPPPILHINCSHILWI